MHSFALRFVTLVIFAILVSACGKRPQVVTGIQVQSQVINQDLSLSLKADLDLGNMTFPAVALPILHPRGQMPIGKVELTPVLGGKNQIKISVNVSSLADIQAIQATLPNGNLVPLIANNATIVVPLGSGAKLYLTVAANAVALGVAVPIKTFDGIGSAVGAASLFPVFSIDKVLGAAGIFTSSSAGQNGFALIADVTQYVKMQDIFVPQLANESVNLSYAPQIPSSSKEQKINSMILNLNMKSTKLEIKK
jgi:hypothetical protein